MNINLKVAKFSTVSGFDRWLRRLPETESHPAAGDPILKRFQIVKLSARWLELGRCWSVKAMNWKNERFETDCDCATVEGWRSTTAQRLKLDGLEQS